MTGDRLTRHVERKFCSNQISQFLGDVAIHLIVFGEWFLCGIDIEASTFAELPVIRLIRHVITAWACIRANNGNSQFCGHLPVFAFIHHILIGAGEAGKIPEYRHRAIFYLWWQENGKGHIALVGLALMAIDALRSTKAFCSRNRFHESS
ncbi:hypothetical protein D9M69_522720 [compost metagenome]